MGTCTGTSTGTATGTGTTANTCVSVVVKSAAAKPSTTTKPTVAVSVTADKLGQTVLDSDDESLAEFIGQLSLHKHPRGPTMIIQVSSVLRSEVKREFTVLCIMLTVC